MIRWKRRILSLCILSLVYALVFWALQETAAKKYRLQIESRKDYAEVQAFLKEHNVKPYEISLTSKKAFGLPAWFLSELFVLSVVLGSYLAVDTAVGAIMNRKN